MIGIPTEILEEFHCQLLLRSEKQKITEDKIQQNESVFDRNFVKAAEGRGIPIVGNPTGILNTKAYLKMSKRIPMSFFSMLEILQKILKQMTPAFVLSSKQHF